MIKVHYVPASWITREYRLIRQGLVNNSRVELVDSEEKSDFVFLFYTALGHGPQAMSSLIIVTSPMWFLAGIAWHILKEAGSKW